MTQRDKEIKHYSDNVKLAKERIENLEAERRYREYVYLNQRDKDSYVAKRWHSFVIEYDSEIFTLKSELMRSEYRLKRLEIMPANIPLQFRRFVYYAVCGIIHTTMFLSMICNGLLFGFLISAFGLFFAIISWDRDNILVFGIWFCFAMIFFFVDDLEIFLENLKEWAYL